jgi:hypothetical protein
MTDHQEILHQTETSHARFIGDWWGRDREGWLGRTQDQRHTIKRLMDEIEHLRSALALAVNELSHASLNSPDELMQQFLEEAHHD